VANEGFSSTGRLNLGADTIRGYLRGAKDWLAARLQLVVDISAADGSGKLHPFLSDTLASRQTWTEPKEKREAFTSAMFDYMFNNILSKAAKDTSALFDIWKRQSLTGRVLGFSPAHGSANTLKLRHGRAPFPKYRTVSMRGIGLTRPLHLCTVTSHSTQKRVTGLLTTTSTG